MWFLGYEVNGIMITCHGQTFETREMCDMIVNVSVSVTWIRVKGTFASGPPGQMFL